MNMNKRMLKVAVTTALAVAFAVPAFANPFTDVPAKHWSYAAVTKLSQAGIIDGYADGTFKGDKMVTRYEMAQIIAKAMTKSLNADQKSSVDKLAQEFSVELNTMGVKVEGMQQQINNMVKISGDARVRYFDTHSLKDFTDYRARVTFDGKINNDVKFDARLATGSTDINGSGTTPVMGTAAPIRLDTANLTFNALGMADTVGRQDIKLGTGFMMDTQMNGVAAQTGALKLFGGIASSNVSGTQAIPVAHAGALGMKMYGAEYGMNVMGSSINADYLKDVTNNQNFYGINGSVDLSSSVSANAEYIKNNTAGGKAVAYGLKFNKVGLSVTHRDVDASAFTNYSNLVNPAFDTASAAIGGFKGMEYQYDKAIAKNVAFTAKYQDFDKKSDGTKIGSHASAAVNVKF